MSVDVSFSPTATATWAEQEVVLGDTRYRYHFGADCVDRIAWHIGQYQADRLLVVSDDTVLALHGDTVLPELATHAPVEVMSAPPGEGMKSLQALVAHLDRAIEGGATRRSVVVALGGGVPGNLAGLMAGLLFRGVRLVHIPTTTVAAMDSTISLKQAVNSGKGKNQFGMYHPPRAVFTDVTLMQTLPVAQLRSGLCEMTKNCLAISPGAIPGLRAVLASGDWGSQEALLWLLTESLAAKCRVTRTDTREQRSGLILEYGHTVGHAVELCDHRLRGAAGISHGEAVAIGLRVAARVSAAMGILSLDDVLLHDDLVGALGVAGIPAGIRARDVLAVIRADNKRGYLDIPAGQAPMVLLRAPGIPLGPEDLPLVPVDIDLIGQCVEATTRGEVYP